MPEPMQAVTDRQLLEAVSLAARAHENQYRKDGKTPYASHPFRVCLVLRDVFGVADRGALIAALLHDTLEDTTTDFDDLAEQFGPEVADWVARLTKDSRLPEDKREVAYCEGLASSPWQVKVCKLADMYDNLHDLAQLPAAKQARTFVKLRQYLDALNTDLPVVGRNAWVKVDKMLQQMSTRI
jgi:(p)ppGpp synthase/HD superfamily hydrolase